MRPFVVFALPRSRTYWLSRFLSYGEWTCEHDQSRYLRGLDDVRSWLSQEFTGTVETAAAPWWRLLAKVRPDTRVAVVRRPHEEVSASLRAMGYPVQDGALARLDRKLTQIERRWPKALSVRYDDLGTEDGCRAIFEHCLPYAFDREWWGKFAAVNLQCSIPAIFRYFSAYQRQLEKMGEVAKQAILSDFALREPHLSDGLTIQTEPFEIFLRDGVSLFAEHSTLVGEAPSSYLEKNLPLHRAIDQAGNMQVVTARQNGRMFGYLMTIEAPSFEREGERTAVQTARFASPEFPGLGLKLMRAALRVSKARGIAEVFMRSGVRGSGDRVSSIYRRCGASEDGQMFRLSLRGA